MASCLGLYIESNLIKYAKVTKERDLLKVDAFGVKFYDKIGPAINQIISETYSFKTPISINLSDEVYQYFYFFSLLNKNDLKKAIETEFESYCTDKGFNRNALETRYALVPDLQDTEKIKTIYISTNKAEINKKLQELAGNSVSYMVPLPMCIPNVAEIKEKENVVIVNLEEKTTLTTIAKGQIYDITNLEQGMGDILANISLKENSYSKAYEICKNTTIYTVEAKELETEENLYLEDIMPTLYNIIQAIREKTDTLLERIDRIYITGTGTVINNIDLYFQEYFSNVKCEILKPYFIPENLKINIKDYIEVNSAIALAMQGLGYGIKTINFKKQKFSDKIPENLKIGKPNKKGEEGEKKKINLKIDWRAKLDIIEKSLVRTGVGALLFAILYSTGSILFTNEMNKKSAEADSVRKSIEEQINLVNTDIKTLNNKTSDYQQITENLRKYSQQTESDLRAKNAIPLLLTRIMNVIPKGVTLTSIENTTGSHIVINAQSEDYDLLGIFKGTLGVNEVLQPSTIISTSGVKQGGVIRIVIEGDLP